MVKTNLASCEFPRRNEVRENQHANLGVLILIGGILTMTLAGCATTIVPPPSPQQPVTVYLLDHGRTSSLAVPRDDGSFTRYVYGDWNWYALMKVGFVQGIAALFWPTQGALGRGIINRPSDMRDMLRKFDLESEKVFAIHVDRRRVDELNRRMDDIFLENADSLVRNEPYALEFVRHPSQYTICYNSNHAVA